MWWSTQWDAPCELGRLLGAVATRSTCDVPVDFECELAVGRNQLGFPSGDLILSNPFRLHERADKAQNNRPRLLEALRLKRKTNSAR